MESLVSRNNGEARKRKTLVSGCQVGTSVARRDGRAAVFFAVEAMFEPAGDFPRLPCLPEVIQVVV